MYYEEKWIDGWLWYRRALDEPWRKVSDEYMIARMRHALELIVDATDGSERGERGLSWLRCSLLAVKAIALTALGY
jgi:hypothetical protein